MGKPNIGDGDFGKGFNGSSEKPKKNTVGQIRARCRTERSGSEDDDVGDE